MRSEFYENTRIPLSSESRKIVSLVLFIMLTFGGFQMFSTTHSQHQRHNNRHLLSMTCSDAIREENACELVKLYCETDTIFNYYEFVYCSPKEIRWLTILTLGFAVAYLFLSLATSAEGFFCPVLSTLSDTLKLSQNVAGVTFLAVGNGAPDLFSSFSAMTKDAPELSFSAILGAGTFVTSVVVGTIAIWTSFKVTRRPFFRDILFYLSSVCFLLFVVIDGEIFIWESIALILLYMIYVIVVIVGRSIYQRNKKKNPLLAKFIRSDSEVSESSSSSSIKYQSDDSFAENGEPKIRSKSFGSVQSTDYISIPSRPRSKSSGNSIKKETIEDGILTADLKARISEKLNSETGLFSDKEIVSKSERKVGWESVFSLLFPALVDFKEKNIGPKIFSILVTPIQFLLSTTIPQIDNVVDEDDRLYGYHPWWNKYITALHCLTIPLFISWGVGVLSYPLKGNFGVWSLILCISPFFSATVLFSTTNDHPPKGSILLAFLAFACSVIWIYNLAGELVGLIEVFGNIFKISESLLGLTVLAWGNSIGDLISNTTIARMGYPGMGVSACYGSPLLNLLLGIGVSTTYRLMSSDEPLYIDLNINLIAIFTALITVLISTVIFVPLNKFKGGKYFGSYLITLFVLSTTFNIVVEFTDILK